MKNYKEINMRRTKNLCGWAMVCAIPCLGITKLTWYAVAALAIAWTAIIVVSVIEYKNEEK